MPLSPFDDIDTIDLMNEGRIKVNSQLDSLRVFANTLESDIQPETVEETITQAAHGLVVGDAVYHNGTSYVKASTTTFDTAEVVGLVSSVIDTDNFLLSYYGRINTLSGLTAGEVYFLQDDGSLGTTIASIAKPLLVATSSTSGVIVNYLGAKTTELLDADTLDGLDSTAFALSAHTHTEADITDLGNYLSVSDIDTLAELNAIITDATLVGDTHTHTESDITDLGNYSLVGHTHLQDDITNLLITPEDTERLQFRYETTSTTLALTDLDSGIRMDSASATTVTIPLNSSVAFSVGSVVEVLRWGTGTVTISPEAGVTINSSDAQTGARDVATQYGSIFVRKIATDTWHLMGDVG